MNAKMNIVYLFSCFHSLSVFNMVYGPWKSYGIGARSHKKETEKLIIKVRSCVNFRPFLALLNREFSMYIEQI